MRAIQSPPIGLMTCLSLVGLVTGVANAAMPQSDFCQVMKEAVAESPSGFSGEQTAGQLSFLPKDNLMGDLACGVRDPGADGMSSRHFHCDVYRESLEEVDHRLQTCFPKWYRETYQTDRTTNSGSAIVIIGYESDGNTVILIRSDRDQTKVLLNLSQVPGSQ